MNKTIRYKAYTGTVEYSEKDKVWYGRVLGISSLISYEADSFDELEQAFKGAVEDYLEMCRAKGIDHEVIREKKEGDEYDKLE